MTDNASCSSAFPYNGINFLAPQARINGRDIGCGNINGQYQILNYHLAPGHSEGLTLREVLSWLKPYTSDYLPMHEAARSKRAPGTGGWFFETTTFQLWVADENLELPNLHCIGIPGAGKTTIVPAIIEVLQERFSPESGRSDNGVVLYAYFRHDTQSSQTIGTVLASLLYQLLKHRGQFSEDTRKLYEKYLDSLNLAPTSNDTQKALLSELSVFKICYVVVDALDEYCVKDCSLSYPLVTQLLRLNTRLLITSRPHIKLDCNSFLTLHVSAQAKDIRKFVENHSKQGISGIIKRCPDLLEEIVEVVIDKSEGMFIIAKLLVDAIMDCLTARDIRATLRTLPSGLDDTYHLTMSRIGKQSPHLVQLAKNALHWVYFWRHEGNILKVQGLQHAVSFRSEMATISEEDMIEEEQILSACAGLLTFVKREDRAYTECQFAHFTTKEFFDKYRDEYFPEGERYITETCLEYLTLSVSSYHLGVMENNQVYDSDDELQVMEYHWDAFPLHAYAASEWGNHARSIDEDFDLRKASKLFAMELPRLFTLLPYGHDGEDMDCYCDGCLDAPGTRSSRHSWILFFSCYGLFKHLQIYLPLVLRQQQPTMISINTLRTTEGYTVLHLAIGGWEGCHLKVLELLLDFGSDPNGGFGNTPVHLAAINGPPEAVTMLIDRGGDINGPGEDGKTPLTCALDPSVCHVDVPWQSTNIIKALLDCGADADLPDNVGKTAILYALERQDTAIVRLLLQYEIDIDRFDKFGNTPLSLARRFGNAQIQELFEGYAKTHPQKKASKSSWRGDSGSQSSRPESTFLDPQLEVGNRWRLPPSRTTHAESLSRETVLTSVLPSISPFQIQPTSFVHAPPFLPDWPIRGPQLASASTLAAPSFPSTASWSTPNSFLPIWKDTSDSSTSLDTCVVGEHYASLTDGYGRSFVSAYDQLTLQGRAYPQFQEIVEPAILLRPSTSGITERGDFTSASWKSAQILQEDTEHACIPIGRVQLSTLSSTSPEAQMPPSSIFSGSHFRKGKMRTNVQKRSVELQLVAHHAKSADEWLAGFSGRHLGW